MVVADLTPHWQQEGFSHLMKYNKGEFVTVPNKSALRGLSPNLQVLFFWLCDHSDDNMKSFPSRKALADECGMSMDSVDRGMRQLVRLGMVKKTARSNGVEQTTNLYEIVILDADSGTLAAESRGVAAESGQVAAETTLGSRTQRHGTQPIELNPSKIEAKASLSTKADPNPKVQVFFFMLVKALGFSETTKFTSGRNDKLRKRLKTYKGSEILRAATNLGADAYMQGDNDTGKRWGTIDYLLRCDENIDKYLQVAEIKFTEGAF